jgi:hypothetical protein
MDDDAPDTPSGHVNLTDMTTISALVPCVSG